MKAPSNTTSLDLRKIAQHPDSSTSDSADSLSGGDDPVGSPRERKLSAERWWWIWGGGSLA